MEMQVINNFPDWQESLSKSSLLLFHVVPVADDINPVTNLSEPIQTILISIRIANFLSG